MDKAIQMETLYTFDMVHDANRVMRKLIQCMSMPGGMENLKICGTFGQNQAHDNFLKLAATLLDPEVTFYVEQSPELETAIAEMTGAAPAAPTDGDYLFAPGLMDDAQAQAWFTQAKTGSYADPHRSATVILAAGEKGDCPVTLAGPGIKAQKTVMVNNYVKTMIEAVKALDIPYPLGLDLVFIFNDDDMLALPRLTKVVA